MQYANPQTTVCLMDFTPEEIRNLRKRLGMNQTEFGQELFLHDEHTAQVKISKLERGIIRPSAAVKRSLLRLAENRLGPKQADQPNSPKS